MASWVMKMMFSAGVPAIALLMFIENVFPPIPSELIMPLAGYMVSQGKLSMVGIIVAGTIGSVLGALPLYYLGRKVGEERLKKLADRHGRWVTVSGDEIDKAKHWFDRHGGAAVFFCRLVPGVRSLISIPAGIAEMNLGAFLAYTTVGSAIWTGLLAYLGYILGSNFKQVEKYLDPASWIVFGGLIAWYLWRVVRHGKEKDQPGSTANSRDAASHTRARDANARPGR
jgi:membrane protein DedA with SNARE-associated domain